MISSCLLTNDDGPDLHLGTTVSIIRPLVHKLVVVVPERDQIAVSSAITTGSPITLRLDPGRDLWLVSGYPADGVRYTLTRLLEQKPTVLVSGINGGHNLGRCVVNSGTIGAAFEGTRHGISALCLSADYTMKQADDTWCSAVQDLVRRSLDLLVRASGGPYILNVNLPRHISQPLLRAVFLPVSSVEYDEHYDEKISDGRREILRRGESLVPDHTIPDLCLLADGKAVVNLIPTPWSTGTESFKEELRKAFPEDDA